MFKNYILIALISSAILLANCSYTQDSNIITYEWENHGITFNYSGYSPWIKDELTPWQVFEHSENALVISPIEPSLIDTHFLYSWLKIIPNTDLENQIQELKNIDSYSYVEIQNEQTHSDLVFTIVHIHSTGVDMNTTNFYLTEINGNVLQYEAGILDYELTNSVLNSIKFN